MLRLVHSWTHSSFLQTFPQQPDRAKNTRFDSVGRNAKGIGDLGVRPLLDHGQPGSDPEFRRQFIEGRQTFAQTSAAMAGSGVPVPGARMGKPLSSDLSRRRLLRCSNAKLVAILRAHAPNDLQGSNRARAR